MGSMTVWHCDFCFATEDEADFIVVSDMDRKSAAAICGECIDTAAACLAEQRAKKAAKDAADEMKTATSPDTTTGAPPRSPG